MKKFQIVYTGNAMKGKRLSGEIIEALNARDAIRDFYQMYFDFDFFPQDDGSIENANGEVIAEADDANRIAYDGGFFYAESVFSEAEMAAAWFQQKGVDAGVNDSGEVVIMIRGENRDDIEVILSSSEKSYRADLWKEEHGS
jgi:hypothetical protein